MAANSRIGSIDFWRGAVLVAILVDHIPGNGLEHVTPRNFGFSDSAEAFVFLSGLSVGAAYLPRAAKQGFAPVGKACGNRALLLYLTHIGLTLAAILLFGAVATYFGASEVLQAHGRDLPFRDPPAALGSILLMTHQLGYFNILPLYIVVMALAPAVLMLTVASPALALAASTALYVATRGFGFSLPTWPEPGTWFFNPFAWQLSFALGVVVAKLRNQGVFAFRPALAALAALIVLMGAIIVSDGFGLWPGLRAAVEPWIDVGKQNMGVGRLVNFLAIAYLLSHAPLASRLISSRFGAALQRLGRHSLSVFAAGSLLSAVGQALLVVVAHQTQAPLEEPLGFVYTLVSAAALFLLANRLECRDKSAPPSSGGKFAPPSAPPSWASRPSLAR